MLKVSGSFLLRSEVEKRKKGSAKGDDLEDQDNTIEDMNSQDYVNDSFKTPVDRMSIPIQPRKLFRSSDHSERKRQKGKDLKIARFGVVYSSKRRVPNKVNPWKNERENMFLRACFLCFFRQALHLYRKCESFTKKIFSVLFSFKRKSSRR